MSIEVRQNGQYMNLVLSKPTAGVIPADGDNFEATLKYDAPREVGGRFKKQDGSPRVGMQFSVLLHSVNGNAVEKEVSFVANDADKSVKFGRTLAQDLAEYGAGTRVKCTYKMVMSKQGRAIRTWATEVVGNTNIAAPAIAVSSEVMEKALESLVKKSINEFGEKLPRKIEQVRIFLNNAGITEEKVVAELFERYTKAME